jgi:hypothetical protein
MSNHWIAVASAEHVLRGRAGGFIQVCHGKATPLRRIAPDDCVVCYSPPITFGGKDRLQAFTAIGVVRHGDPYAADLGDGFRPFRRDVTWAEAKEAQIKPLLDALQFSAGNANWGYQLRRGLIAISEHDCQLIADAMQARIPHLASPRSC